jgi:hypothetical protein
MRTKGRMDGQTDRRAVMTKPVRAYTTMRMRRKIAFIRNASFFFFLESTKLVLLKSGFGSYAASIGGYFICVL